MSHFIWGEGNVAFLLQLVDVAFVSTYVVLMKGMKKGGGRGEEGEGRRERGGGRGEEGEKPFCFFQRRRDKALEYSTYFPTVKHH